MFLGQLGHFAAPIDARPDHRNAPALNVCPGPYTPDSTPRRRGHRTGCDLPPGGSRAQGRQPRPRGSGADEAKRNIVGGTGEPSLIWLPMPGPRASLAGRSPHHQPVGRTGAPTVTSFSRNSVKASLAPRTAEARSLGFNRALPSSAKTARAVMRYSIRSNLSSVFIDSLRSDSRHRHTSGIPF
jgi:hypothetical protein